MRVFDKIMGMLYRLMCAKYGRSVCLRVCVLSSGDIECACRIGRGSGRGAHKGYVQLLCRGLLAGAVCVYSCVMPAAANWRVCKSALTHCTRVHGGHGRWRLLLVDVLHARAHMTIAQYIIINRTASQAGDILRGRYGLFVDESLHFTTSTHPVVVILPVYPTPMFMRVMHVGLSSST